MPFRSGRTKLACVCLCVCVCDAGIAHTSESLRDCVILAFVLLSLTQP
jgi:hypothetical protein